ncbi:unnamed protein product [Litomosoides sigmodontis]|uniref:Uncharacterized protein n=1 Tax=Litomosoides sigmodontis TaxID=42156 RepID=A0A3P6TVM5_LITSI|nr:unnamed protein product [Litomosoides sigmodontis]
MKEEMPYELNSVSKVLIDSYDGYDGFRRVTVTTSFASATKGVAAATAGFEQRSVHGTNALGVTSIGSPTLFLSTLIALDGSACKL